MRFEIEQQDDVWILRISGRLASDADGVFLRMKAQEIKSLGCRKLVVDICELDSIGSMGIGFFTDLYASITKHADGQFVLAGPSPRVVEVLSITGLTRIIPMVEDLVAGLAFCSSKEEIAKSAGE